MDDARRRIYDRLLALHPDAIAPSAREIEYRETKPVKLKGEIPLYEYVERIKRIKTDKFQRDLCDRLQQAAMERPTRRTWAVIHAEAQLGKTIVISQCFPAWLFGEDPLFRFVLAMYNETRSAAHSSVVLQILNGSTHQDIYRSPDGLPATGTRTGWITRARRELNDGQLSFNPVGLRSGITGSGFDWLGIDDPYADVQDAFSAAVREQLQNFWDYTVKGRVGPYSCITGMFHRYSASDLAGYLLDSGEVDYWRYATVADGDYVHERTQRRYPDPLGRAEGEYISPERRPPDYYTTARKNKRVWLSMFQGRPSSVAGDFFRIDRIGHIPPEDAAKARSECLALVRSWDHASSKDPAAAYTVGTLAGINADGKMVVFDIWRRQADTAEREAAQLELAARDGHDVIVTVPRDPGAAGEAVVFHVQQKLAGFQVLAVPTTSSKEVRASNVSTCVNNGEVLFIDDSGLPTDERWNNIAKMELRDFPHGDRKDIVDTFADAYNTLFEILRRGTVIKNLGARHLVPISLFRERFGDTLPQHWTAYAAIKTSLDASRPTCGVIVARAAVNSGMPDTLFVLGEHKVYTSRFEDVLDWLSSVKRRVCPANELTVWAHPDCAPVLPTLGQKTDYRVALFRGDASAGLTEINWHLQTSADPDQFGPGPAPRLYFVCADDQVAAPDRPADGEASAGFYHARQEARTWLYDDKGKPGPGGGVLDCLRIVAHKFRTYAAPLTVQEEFDARLDAVKPREGQEFTRADQQRFEWARALAEDELREKYGEDAFDDDGEGEPWWR